MIGGAFSVKTGSYLQNIKKALKYQTKKADL